MQPATKTFEEIVISPRIELYRLRLAEVDIMAYFCG